ncbi:MAG: hypothetical protein E7324_05450 [Clostridiales bacterium]|nr:hypothetical protein [Clostridiales bacterium]
MKKSLFFALCLALAAAVAITGVIAFYQDQDHDLNVMTLGNVRIAQTETDRNGNEFAQDQRLFPVVNSADPASDPSYVDKVVTVSNTGKNIAYVRTLIAVPLLTWEEGGENMLHWDHSDSNAWDWSTAPVDITLDGIVYRVFFAYHIAPLAPGSAAAPSLTGIYLDSRVDFDAELGYFCRVEGEKKPLANISVDQPLKVLVVSQAVQETGFADARSAFASSFDNGAAPESSLVASWFTANP